MAMSTTLETTAHATPRVQRLLSVAGAVVAAAAVWIVSVPLLGTQLVIRFGSGAPQTIGIDYVLGASVITSLLGWGLLALLERRSARGRTIWTAVAVVALVASLSLPLIAGVSTSAKVTLIVMHLAVAAILIPGLRRGSSAPARQR
jgi:hypothetical protein